MKQYTITPTGKIRVCKIISYSDRAAIVEFIMAGKIGRYCRVNSELFLTRAAAQKYLKN